MKTILILVAAVILFGCSAIQQHRHYNLVLQGCDRVTINVVVASEHADELTPTTTAPIDVNLPITPLP